jgi:hypothetical protein
VTHFATLVARWPFRGAHRSSLIVFLLLASCGTERLYPGPKLPPQEVAVVHVGDTIVLQVDGTRRRGGYLSRPRIEVTPGRHTLALVFEKAARPVGSKEMPAMRGEGTCTLELDAQAGKQYWLGARAVGEDWTGLRWEGKWTAWIRDPSVSDEDDVIARCDSQPTPEDERGVATPSVTPEAEAEREETIPAPVAASRPMPERQPPAAPKAPALSHPSSGFAGGLDPAVWIVRSRDNYRVVIRRLCSAEHCWTESYLQTLVPRRNESEGAEHLVMEEKTTVPIAEASSVATFVEEVGLVDRQGTFAFELHIANKDDASAARVRLLVFPLPDGGYRATRVAP